MLKRSGRSLAVALLFSGALPVHAGERLADVDGAAEQVRRFTPVPR